MDTTDNFGRQVQRIDALVNEIRGIADPKTKASATELVQSLMSLHGAGLERLMSLIAQAGEPGDTIIDNLARDELVAGLLLLYGLHPVSIEERVRKAVDKTHSGLLKSGVGVEFVDIEDGVVRIRLQIRANGRSPSAQSVQSAVESAIFDAAPDVTAVTFQDVVTFVPLESLHRNDVTNQSTQRVRRVNYETATGTAAGND